MTDADALRKAAQIVREKGLARGVGWDDEGRVCLHAAIIEALGGNRHSSPGNRGIKLLCVVDRTVRTLGLPCSERPDGHGKRGYPSVQWSNDWAKDADEVAHILKLAAEDAELQGV